jgi:hypothetical protein
MRRQTITKHYSMSLFFKICISGVVLGFGMMFFAVVALLLFTDSERKWVQYVITHAEQIIGIGGICALSFMLLALLGCIWL